MIKLILVRHGQSMWNLENRFTGWTDVELSEQGIKEAKEAGKVLKEKGYLSSSLDNAGGLTSVLLLQSNTCSSPYFSFVSSLFNPCNAP